ncbi:MAG TPA: VCBS repeat-containing protein, partial [Cryomorphaceae bacterium]|nr:VCBS repeat-containing protein [Cryomorphaceae bacterium]
MSFAQITFEDVAQDVNLNWEGKSFGASWADVTGDGFPDLFMQCHSNFFDAYFNDDLPRYYFNNAGSFVQQEILDEISETDWHGGMMFDLDNDGDLDHLSVTGGSSANIFFVNDNGNFDYVNQAVEFGLDNDGGVGRSPSVIDANNDGFLDVLLNDLDHGTENVGPRLLMSESGLDFTDSTAEYNLDWPQSSFSVSNDLLGNNNLNVIYLAGRATVTTLSENQFQQEFQFPSNRVYDFTLNDFNGDLMPDIFLARASKYDVFDQVNNDLIRGYVSYTPLNEVMQMVFSAETETPVINIFPRSTSTDYLVVAGNSLSNGFEGEVANIDLNTAQNGFIGIPAIEDTLTTAHIY